MRADQKANSFFFEDRPVGYFEDDQLPCSPGSYRYVPYRGPGHLQLQQALVSQGPQRCHYIAKNAKRYFTVVACPAHGLLELANFDVPDAF
jgi:hypothetical protein